MNGLFDFLDPKPKIDTGNAELDAAILSVNTKIEDYNKASEKVDRLINELEKTEPGLAMELRLKREDARGFYDRYVAPAYQEMLSFLGLTSQSMGLIPLLGVGAVLKGTALTAGAGAVIYGLSILKDHLDEATERERVILNDPDIPQSVKLRIITGESSGMTYALVGGAGALALVSYLIYRRGRS